ncbi:hypothetical protein [Williamsia limnetica]|jgi:hypothetical protein|uniref:hypothetical protein n=1 Tax=Williamsia limnetica TaxID=882452 RepID=UPI000D7BF6CB|nr:hypothetical protein [Williamsia limnetica]
MAASESDAAEIQRVREALAAAEAALDGLISELGAASPDADTQSEEAARRTEERAAALTGDIDRLRRQVEQFRDRVDRG